MALGCAGDAFRLRLTGDPTDRFHRCPTTDDGRRTPVGVCWNAPCLVLDPQRGRIDWRHLLGSDGLHSGSVLSGVAVWVIYLSDADWLPLLGQTDGAPISLDRVRELAARDDLARRRRGCV